VVAKEPVTCMVFSPGQPSNFAGRGEGAVFGGAHLAHEVFEDLGPTTNIIDVSAFIEEKVCSIAAHRTQCPITPDMFPHDILNNLFGREYFVRVFPSPRIKTVL
jgi:hypothetical protein